MTSSKALQPCNAAARIAHDGERAGPTGSIDAVAKVLIIGASRGIGLETVRAALEARPVGVAVAHDGALLVSEDANGTIWRVSYSGGP